MSKEIKRHKHGEADRQIIIAGRIKPEPVDGDDYGISIQDSSTGKYTLLSVLMSDKLVNQKYEYVELEGRKDTYAAADYIFKNLFVRYYVSAEPLTLAEVQEKHLNQFYGDLDIKTDWVGYSEWTVLGTDTFVLKIGGHDIEKELLSHLGKHLVMVISKANKQ